ncbi:hypothetical protein [Clostridium sp.]|uniref:pectate lyase family protein n=1 Tax=Clostridium sp. TaxID=1506 RepID=UPI0028490A22|nr:hypothetical protein [Clostridium sp.]MDR3598065.1 hypothetical protein [Clostridium sp.]
MRLKHLSITLVIALAVMFTCTSNLFGATKAEAATTGGYSTSTGSTATSVTVSTLAQLQSAVAAGNHHIIISGTIYGGSTLATIKFTDTSWNNVTIEGASGGKAALENIQLKFDGELLSSGTNISNIVVKNINFYGNIPDLQKFSGTQTQPGGLGTNYEGLSFRRCTNVLVDHCTLYDMSDDLMSVALASDNVTISYCHFYFTSNWINMNPNPIWNWVGTNQDLASERLAMVIGANKNDSYTYGGNKLHVTMHHNWFGPYMKGRPLMRGFVHLYNNYFDNSTAPTGNNSAGYSQQQFNANQVCSGSNVYSESNYFYKTNQSNLILLDNSGDSYSFYERNNSYKFTTGTSATGSAYPSTLPFSYNYLPEAVDNVPNDVEANAGPK